MDEKTKPETTEPEKNEPEKNEPEKFEPEKNEPEKNETEKNEPEKNEPEKKEPEKNEPESTGAVKKVKDKEQSISSTNLEDEQKEADNQPRSSGSASTSPVTGNIKADAPEWKLARIGITMILNNKGLEAEEFFLQYPNSLIMYSGYSYAIFMDAIMSLEEDKLTKATQILKEVERRCAVKTGWLKNVFGSKPNDSAKPSLADQLETQIILADSQVCLATLTFLQSDVSGYFKGTWTLRKAWKLYQKVYKDIKNLYKETVGEPQLPESEMAITSPRPGESEQSDWDIPDSPIPTTGYPTSSHKPNIPKSKSSHFNNSNNFSSSKRKNSVPLKNGFNGLTMKKSVSFHNSLSSNQGFENESFWNSRFGIRLPNSLSFSYLTSLHLFSTDDLAKKDIDKETVKRLMCGVSFGYGLLQLGISLLPPTFLKFTQFLGFSTSKENGIACLMYSRLGVDMRAPLATLSLLWYHTVVRPFYGIDGSNVRMGAEAAGLLIAEYEDEFAESSLFLFFKGRMYRLLSDIPAALKCFQQSVDNAEQREIKLLALHEEGWCYLITLDFFNAKNSFIYLKSYSRWSRGFYSYCAAICTGACDKLIGCAMFEEVKVANKKSSKSSQLSGFLTKRADICPNNSEEFENLKPFYWRLLVYEMLYLWNALASCNTGTIDLIIQDCNQGENEGYVEPLLGLTKLMAGNCYLLKKDYEKSIENFRSCLQSRSELPNNAKDTHISAFAQYELATILILNEETKSEGKKLLEEISQYSGYDFEQTLSVRVNTELKRI